MPNTLRAIVIVIVGSVALIPRLAAQPSAFVIWSGSQLKAYRETLSPKINEKKLATAPLATFGNHLAMVAHREGDGEAELHEKQADFLVVQTGEATLVVGGDVVDGKTTAPGEIRGPSIKGGERRPLAAGDIVHITAKIPHQLLVAPGKEFTYFVIKVDTP